VFAASLQRASTAARNWRHTRLATATIREAPVAPRVRRSFSLSGRPVRRFLNGRDGVAAPVRSGLCSRCRHRIHIRLTQIMHGDTAA
jgi:hypothetical protein